MSTLERLIRSLPLYFDHDPIAVTVLQVFYDGTGGVVVIEQRQLQLLVMGGSGESLTISLAGKTMAQVAALINAEEGYQAVVSEGYGGVAADTLYESSGVLTTGATLQAYTSLLWRVLAPLAWAIEYSRQNVLNGWAQMAIPTAGGHWLDLWGDLYGGIHRRALESDATYAARIMREVRRIRLTIPALETIIEEELGVKATIRNLHEDAWIVAETNFGILAGRRHARTTFEVRVDRSTTSLSMWFDAQLRYLIDRNRAAGTLPFYISLQRGGDLGGDEPTVVYTGKSTIRSAVSIASSLLWMIGESPLGDGYLSMAANVGSLVVVTTNTGGGGGDPLILGTDELGTHQLGA